MEYQPTVKRLFTIKQLTDFYGCTDCYWRTQIEKGRLPYITVGRKRLIDNIDVEKFISDNKRVS